MDYVNFFKKLQSDWKMIEPGYAMGDSLLILSMLRCAFELQKKTEEVFAVYDLNTATFGVLATLYRSGGVQGMTPSEISNHVLVTPGSVTNRIDRLEERELIKRVYLQEDRRSQKIVLTSKGKKLVKEILPIHLENEKSLLKGLSHKEKIQLNELVLKFLNQLN